MRIPFTKPVRFENRVGDVLVNSTDRCISDAVAGQLSKLEVARTNCKSNLSMRENVAKYLLIMLVIYCALGISLRLPLPVMVLCVIVAFGLISMVSDLGSS